MWESVVMSARVKVMNNNLKSKNTTDTIKHHINVPCTVIAAHVQVACIPPGWVNYADNDNIMLIICKDE